MLQLETVSANLASPATETDLRITCAEVLGAVGHANAEAAQAVLNQQGAHAFFLSCNEYKARFVGQHIDLSKPLCILALLYDKRSEQQAAVSFMRALLCILHQVVLHLLLCNQNERDSLLRYQMTKQC